MVSRQPQRSIASALCALLALTPLNAVAKPYPKDDLHAAGYGYLMPRQCNQYCGMDNQYCCSAGTQCYTSNGIAGCSADAGGGVAFYTTTWTSTGTFTSTISSFFGVATAGSGDCVPKNPGESACGSICCASWQKCAFSGQCIAKDKMPGPVSSGGQAVTTQFSAPYRVTSGGIPTGPTTTTGTAAGATTTDGGGGVAPGGTAGGGLSPGAIAGIVIGTLAGIVLLILICACCIIRGLWHGALAILGIGKKKETVVEEEYRRSSSRHSRRDNHGSWYGGGGRPSTVTSRKEKKSSGKGLLGLGAALGTLWLLLGLRKKDKKKSTKSRSDVSSSYWSDSYTATSPSSMSSDRRTRRSRRSGTSRTSRVTRTTRVSRVPSPRSPRSPPR